MMDLIALGLIFLYSVAVSMAIICAYQKGLREGKGQAEAPKKKKEVRHIKAREIAERQRIDAILTNIDNYNGDGSGQIDVINGKEVL